MLTEKLAELSQKGKAAIPEEIYAKMAKNLQALQDTHIEENTIKAGDRLPDFKLIDSGGKTYTKDDFRGKKLVLNFFRGSW